MLGSTPEIHISWKTTGLACIKHFNVRATTEIHGITVFIHEEEIYDLATCIYNPPPCTTSLITVTAIDPVFGSGPPAVVYQSQPTPERGLPHSL